MTDRKKNRSKKFDEDEPPTKEEYAVAKFLRFHVPTREGRLHSMEVNCFFASAAVDALLESKWSVSRNAKEPLFFNRQSCVHYCQRLMQKGLFHRAERVQRKKDKEKGDKSKKKKGKEAPEKDDAGISDEIKERKNRKDKKAKKDREESGTNDKLLPSEREEGEKKEDKVEEKKEEKKEEGKKKKEKRLKLVMTDDQRFLDGEENIYVWIYDPANAKTLVIGSLIVLGAIALCLFPLWPEVVRLGVYYLSLVAAAFVGCILALVVLRLILFCFIWVLTLGRHHFWLLPNLTEDVGFFDSFRPLYQHDSIAKEESAASKVKGKGSSTSSSSSKSSKKVDRNSKVTAKSGEKCSDKEDTGSEQEEFEVIQPGEVDQSREREEEGEIEGRPGEDDDENDDDDEEHSQEGLPEPEQTGWMSKKDQ